MATIPTRIDLSRLAPTGGPVVGRGPRVQEIESAWTDPDTRVLWLAAGGGMGKSALVQESLASLRAQGFAGADRVFGWTFHGQGAAPAHASADAFLDYALRWFGDDAPASGSPWERGTRLARRVQGQRTLLVLDGVEEHQGGEDGGDGRLLNPSLSALVGALGRRNPGLCIVTSRRRLDAGDAADRGTPTPGPGDGDLVLDLAATTQLFGDLDAEEDQIETAHEVLSGHPYALAILVAHIRHAFDGDVGEALDQLFPAKQPVEDPVKHMLTECEEYFVGNPDLAGHLSLLRLAGFLDGPAAPAAVRAVRGDAVIPDLTEGLGPDVSDADVQAAVAALRRARLLADGHPGASGALDTPRPVRRYFHAGLTAEAMTAASARLYDHFCGTAPQVPETVEDLLRLHAAVAHGCRGGKPQEAWDRVYRRRISPEDRFWSTFRLGAFDAEVAVLAEFFRDPDTGATRWSEAPAGLTDEAGLAALLAAAVNLRSLGRLEEARTAFDAALTMAGPGTQGAAPRDPRRAADAASGLSEIALARGEIGAAIEHAQQAVEHADAAGDPLRRTAKRAFLADALHQAGRLGEAEVTFREAEALQAGWQPEFDRLYSLRGYQFHDLLLREPEALLLAVGRRPSPDERRRAERQARRVLDRVQQLFGWRRDSDSSLDVALEHLARGRARLARDLARGEAPSEAAGSHLDQGVALLREYAAQYRLPCGLLARAAYRRVSGDLAGAAADLDEAQGIAEHGAKVLLRIDAHLERARLEHARDDLDEARRQLEESRTLMADLGYHRRDREVADLADALA